ncbi:MAG: hypothetical protein ACOCRX_02050 [Candidatus Woesearchaeota archaeon]
MKIIEELSSLKEELDKNFLKNNKLSFVFKMSGKSEFHFGFYNKETEKVTDFGIKEGEIISKDVDNSKSKGILEIDEKAIKNYDELKKKVSKKTGSMKLMKKIYYLFNSEKPIWKVTFIDSSFNTKHINFDAYSLDAESESNDSLTR